MSHWNVATVPKGIWNYLAHSGCIVICIVSRCNEPYAAFVHSRCILSTINRNIARPTVRETSTVSIRVEQSRSCWSDLTLQLYVLITVCEADEERKNIRTTKSESGTEAKGTCVHQAQDTGKLGLGDLHHYQTTSNFWS